MKRSGSVPAAAALADALLGPADASPRVFNRADGRGKLTAARFEDAVADTAPIVYERVGAFQQTMLRLIVQRLAPTREMYLLGEVGAGQRSKPALAPPARAVLVACAHASGAGGGSCNGLGSAPGYAAWRAIFACTVSSAS